MSVFDQKPKTQLLAFYT